MTTTVKLKRSETGSSVPTTSDIVVGEVALNTADQKIYVRDSSNNIKVIGVGADATTSIKGIASFSSSNFTVSSGAVSLNADQSGTITGLGTITTGVWNGTAIGSQYGGTGQDFSSSTGVTYFDSGTASTVSMATKGQLLVGDGSGAPQTLSVGTNDYVLTADSTTGTGVAWKAASAGDDSAAKNMFFFTASTGQTTFTGTDDDGTTLSYNAGTGKTNIYLNGILLDDADYTASNGTSVVLSTAAAANDLLTVEAFIVSTTFELSNDATPQLGGTLDLNGNDITGTGDINTTGNLTISGNLTVNGTTTTVNSTTLTIDDKNIELASTASPSDTTADGGGITLKGDTDHTFNWVNSTDAWTSSEHLDLATGKEYKINGTSLKDVTETLTNKTINSASNTITITESNISDLGSYLENVVEDTTPQLGGNLDTNGNDINFGDNDKAIFGAGSDLQIFHDGSHSYVSDQGTGELRILATDLRINNSASNKSYLRAIDGGALSLFHNGSIKLATTSTGIDVTGTVVSDGLTVDTNTLYVDATNNRVGIGTSSPSHALDIQGSSPTVRILENTAGTLTSSLKLHGNRVGTGGAVTSLEFINTEGASVGTETSVNSIQTWYESAGNQNMRFNLSGSERMRIDSSGNVGIGTTSPAASLDIGTTGSVKVPVGTTLERDGTPATGMFRFNSTTSGFEGYDGSAWGSIGGGASAGGAIYENTDSISADYTITSGTNGFSVGPMTIASGVTVTVPSGQRWVIL